MTVHITRVGGGSAGNFGATCTACDFNPAWTPDRAQAEKWAAEHRLHPHRDVSGIWAWTRWESRAGMNHAMPFGCPPCGAERPNGPRDALLPLCPVCVEEAPLEWEHPPDLTVGTERPYDQFHYLKRSLTDLVEKAGHPTFTRRWARAAPVGQTERRGPRAMQDVQQAYGAMAARYIDLLGTTAEVHADDLDLISRHLSIRRGAVLDVGCGPGHLTAHLRALDVEATGIDVVPEFIDHARTTYPSGRYELGSMQHLPVPDKSVTGVLAWYSLIHLHPDELDAVLAELRRVLATDGTLVVGFFDGHAVLAFEHKVVRAYYWPADELSARLLAAGFTEIERQQRPGVDEAGHRPHGALAARAS